MYQFLLLLQMRFLRFDLCGRCRELPRDLLIGILARNLSIFVDGEHFEAVSVEEEDLVVVFVVGAEFEAVYFEAPQRSPTNNLNQHRHTLINRLQLRPTALGVAQKSIELTTGAQGVGFGALPIFVGRGKADQ